MTRTIRLGILRLVDSAPALVAAHRELFAREGLHVRLCIEPSWANVADKLAYGLLDAAIMLPPLAIAAALGLRGPRTRLIVPAGISLGGNTVVVTEEAAAAVSAAPAGSAAVGRCFAAWVRAQPASPRLAVVHVFSTHHLLFRRWLSEAGIDPDRELDIVALPPERVVEALAAKRIAGFCAGAPWGDLAEREGVGRILFGTSVIWPGHPEKCLAVARSWAETDPPASRALVRALVRAQHLCNETTNRPEIARLLASDAGLSLPYEASLDALPGGSGIERVRFHPELHRSHARWFLAEMRRWAWLPRNLDLERVAQELYRPEFLIENTASSPPSDRATNLQHTK